MKSYFPAAVLAGLLLLLAGCSALERSPQSSPGKLVEAYLEAFQQNDLPLMLQLSDSLDTGAAERAFLEKIVELIERKSFSGDEVELISEEEALVTITVELSLMGQEKSHTEQVRVILKEGQWFLQGGLLDFP